MLFNTLAFAAFLSVFLLVRRLLPTRFSNVLLTLFSWYFYSFWNPDFVILLVGSSVVDYLVALFMKRYPESKRVLLLVSLLVNLGILGFFKYVGFLADAILQLGLVSGLPYDWTVPEAAVPVGISFYTFQTLSYTIDVYRGQIEPRTNFFDFAAYVAFFPQLVAGPIERASHLLPQLEAPAEVSYSDLIVGIQLISRGLFKKLVIADNLAPLVETVFDARTGSGPIALAGMYAFALQIYCDFSGYTDIARGISRWFGISLMENFRMPYFASGPAEFWRRWHISLSTWLRDYLYIPLGGNRAGLGRTYVNLAITMLLGGLWHGPTWMFVLWGAYHGVLLILERLIRGHMRSGNSDQNSLLVRMLAGLFMFHLICLGWVLFRATTIEDLWSWLGRVSAWGGSLTSLQPLMSVLLFGSPILLHWTWRAVRKGGDDDFDTALSPVPFGIITAGLIFGVVTLGADASREFIYFQF